MAPKRQGPKGPADTLADASGKNVEGLLDRQRKRRKKAAGQDQGTFTHSPHILTESRHLPPPRRGANPGPAVCGAPAVACRDEEERIYPDDANPKKTGEASGGVVDSNGKDAAHAANAAHAATIEAHEWQDVDEDEDEEWAEEEAIHESNTAGRYQEGPGGITITMDSDGAKVAAAQPQNKARRTFTKEDREAAQLAHRAHLLCLLGRGLLFDAASDDELLQATVLSLPPSELSTKLSAQSVHSMGSEKSTATGISTLASVLEWFRETFQMAKIAPPTGSEDDITTAILAARGLPAIVERLLTVAAERQGSAEELCSVFEAVLRAHGLVARTVRLLDPSALRPADAARQQERADAARTLATSSKTKRQEHLSRLQSNSTRDEDNVIDLIHEEREDEGGDGGLLHRVEHADLQQSLSSARWAARAGAALISGDETRRRESLKDRLAEQLGLADSSAIRVTPGTGGAGPSISIDASKIKKGSRKKKNGAEHLANGGRGGGGLAPRIVHGDGGKSLRKSKSGELKGEELGASAVEDRTHTVEPQVVSLADVREREESGNTNTGPASARKRKSEEELEQQLAIAMAATAFETQVKPEEEDKRLVKRSPSQDDIDGSNVTGASSGKKQPFTKRRASTTKAAGFGSHQADVGRYWVEVYCGSTDDGRWVHVDPIAGWVDRVGDVEGLAPRGAPISYVVAFANGGAKDVTRRYTSSFVAAERQREGEWWDATLRPLRSKEVAALHDAARRHAGTHTNTHSNTHGINNNKSNNAAAHSSVPPAFSAHHQIASQREDRELEARAAAERRGLPTTIDGFRTHATFILSRHIGKYQALRSGSKALGMHKGEAYYDRRDVGDVHTAERWRRLGREVLPEELGCPAKRIKKRAVPATGPGSGRGGSPLSFMNYSHGSGRGKGRGNAISPLGKGEGVGDAHQDDEEEAAAEGEGEDPASLSAFYGKWQTREWAPPAAVGGKVPKNERGNVEVPPLAAALPAGTVHINLPYITAVCRRLGIDYAAALVGFEIRAGRSVPSLEGVVVCAEHEMAVREAYDEDVRLKAERAKQKRMDAAEEAWRQLLRALLTRVRLQLSYGGDGRGGGGGHGEGSSPHGAEQEAAAMLVQGGVLQQDVATRGGKRGHRRRLTNAAGADADATPHDVDVEEI